MGKFSLIIGLVFVLSACEDLVMDLPNTNIGNYRYGSNEFKFPKGTATIDIYNCLMDVNFSNNSDRTVSGSTYEITQEITLMGVKHTEQKKRNINKIKISYSETEPEIHEYILTLYFDDGSTDFYSNLTPQTKPETHLNCVYNYTWQRQTTNVWKNDKILGELIIKW